MHRKLTIFCTLGSKKQQNEQETACFALEIDLPMDPIHNDHPQCCDDISFRSIDQPLKSCLRDFSSKNGDSSSLSSTCSTTSVEFATTEVHYFEVSLGCNPSVHGGPPLRLGEHISSHLFNIYKYENRKSVSRLRRSASEMYLDKSARRELLIGKHPATEIGDRVREMTIIRNQRKDARREHVRIQSLSNFFGLDDDCDE